MQHSRLRRPGTTARSWSLPRCQPGLADVQARLTAAGDRLDTALQIRGAVAEGAFAAVQADDHAALLAALSDTATANGAAEVDAILLAQYSLIPVADQLQVQLGIPVLSGPTLAAQTLRDAITGEAAGA
jgi:hypothetical protein